MSRDECAGQTGRTVGTGLTRAGIDIEVDVIDWNSDSVAQQFTEWLRIGFRIVITLWQFVTGGVDCLIDWWPRILTEQEFDALELGSAFLDGRVLVHSSKERRVS